MSPSTQSPATAYDTPADKIDAVMAELSEALGASEETAMLSVDKQESGYWSVSTPEGESLDFNGTMSENAGLLVVELFRDEAAVEEFGEVDPDDKQLLSIDDFTLREAVTEVVNQIGYGNIEDILEQHRSIGARVEREGLMPAGFELTHAYADSLQVERKDHTEQVYIGKAGDGLVVRAFRDDRPQERFEVRVQNLESAIKAGSQVLDNWDNARANKPEWFVPANAKMVALASTPDLSVRELKDTGRG